MLPSADQTYAARAIWLGARQATLGRAGNEKVSILQPSSGLGSLAASLEKSPSNHTASRRLNPQE